jgi:hypothetical protein
MRWRSVWKTLFVSLPLVAASGGAAEAGFELDVNFLASPVIECETETNAIGRQECVSLRMEARFANVGAETSPRRRVALNMYRGPRAAGYATRFGGAGALASLPELAPGESVTLSWTAHRVQLGQYTFRPHYTPALEDRGRDQHSKSHTVTIEAAP